MTPNYDESLALGGIVAEEIRNLSPELGEVGTALMNGIHSQKMVITRGKDGMSLFENGHVQRIPTYARQVFDVTGAGDTVIAALAVAWTSGLDLPTSCVLANFAAGHVVSKVGCVPCSTSELVEFIKTHPAELKFDTKALI
jgi:rfaE bifunctional protein kinase chain/domain